MPLIFQELAQVLSLFADVTASLCAPAVPCSVFLSARGACYVTIIYLHARLSPQDVSGSPVFVIPSPRRAQEGLGSQDTLA